MKEQESFSQQELEALKAAAYEGAKEGVKENMKSRKRGMGIGGGVLTKVLSTIIIVVLVIALLPLALSKLNPFSKLASQFSREASVEDHDLTLENNGILGYTAADFAEVILGDTANLKKLEVFSQDMSEMVTLTKAGLGGVKLFSKTKNYTYYGTATYVIDLGKLGQDSISLDEENQTVVLKIPHCELPDNNINVPTEKMTVGDTEKGVLAFGALNASDEESKTLVAEAKEKMKAKLEEENVRDTADKVAEMTVWELYQPLISKAAPGYTLKIEFAAE